MICPMCNKELPDDFEGNCPQCALPIENASVEDQQPEPKGKTMKCIKCGEQVPYHSTKLCEACYKTTSAEGSESNIIASVLNVIAFLVFCIGVFVGVGVGTQMETVDGDFNVGLAFTVWSISAISGMLLLAASEVINYLKQQCEKSDVIIKQLQLLNQKDMKGVDSNGSANS